MEPDGTKISATSAPHQLVHMCRQHYKEHESMSHINDKLNRTKRFSVHVYCTHTAGVSREVTKSIRQAANNVGQPCQLPSHQIHRISRGTPPWTACPLGLPSARLCFHHHLSQRGGPPSLGQGTQRWQDGHQEHTNERHCVLPELNNGTSSQQITTCEHMHVQY